MAEKKEKQYVSNNAQLMAEWDYEKNTELKPETLLLNSNKKFGGSAKKDTNGKHE